MGKWCPLDGWTPDGTAAAWYVFRPGRHLPLMWTASGPHEVPATATPGETWEYLALAAHWATAHPDQLRAFVGEFELDGFPRSPAKVTSKL
jgi:hypothetical protein